MGSRHKDDLAGYEELPEVTGRYQKERSKKTAPVVIPLLVVAVVGAPFAFIIRDQTHFAIYLSIYFPTIVFLIRCGNRREDAIKVVCPRCEHQMIEDRSQNPSRFACDECRTYAIGRNSG